jgi:hypothetical protein
MPSRHAAEARGDDWQLSNGYIPVTFVLFSFMLAGFLFLSFLFSRSPYVVTYWQQ